MAPTEFWNYNSLADLFKRMFGYGLKSDFEKVLLDKLPYVLDEAQKKHKIKNLLQQLKNKGVIYPEGKIWKMSKPA